MLNLFWVWNQNRGGTISGKSTAPSHMFQTSVTWKHEEILQKRIVKSIDKYLPISFRALLPYLFRFLRYEGLKKRKGAFATDGTYFGKFSR